MSSIIDTRTLLFCHIVFRLFTLAIFGWLLSTSQLACAQRTTAIDNDYLAWSASRRLSPRDFQLLLPPTTNLRGSEASFTFGANGHNYELMGKRGNAVIYNKMHRTASWLDTTNKAAVPALLRFHQTLFDIQEVYARRLRQQGKATAGHRLLIGKPTMDDLMTAIIKEAQQRRLQYMDETDYGNLPGQQAKWEAIIWQEIAALQAYAAPEAD